MKRIGVIGSGTCDDGTQQIAYEVGRYIAEAGHAVVCGGLGGVMEGACRGAFDAGGTTIGILPGDRADMANAFVTIPIVTGMGIARNAIVVKSSDVLIAIAGGPGTLSEIAFALQHGVPVVSLGSFDVSSDLVHVSSPEEAVEAALSFLGEP